MSSPFLFNPGNAFRTPYPWWGDEVREWDSRKTAIPTKQRCSLPRQLGGSSRNASVAAGVPSDCGTSRGDYSPLGREAATPHTVQHSKRRDTD